MKILRDSLINAKVDALWGYSFEEFNPIQSTVLKHRKDDYNFIISAKTSAGKTITSELIMEEALSQGKKAVFLSPLKAVTKQNYDVWTSKEHRWSSKKIEIVTGDYVLTEDRIEALNNADIILLTTSMLLSRCRNINSSKSDWIKEVHTVVVDEAHLLGVKDKGDYLEMGLVSFTNINTNARIVKLSATMSNLYKIANWLSNLNGKDTYVLESQYRPVDLDLHFIPYTQISYYRRNEGLFQEISELLKKYSEDKFLVFFHSKQQLQEFYNDFSYEIAGLVIYTADVEKAKREYILKNFKEKDSVSRVILTTPALSLGINSPARRVIIADVRFGRQMIEVHDLKQMAGRAGRKGFDEKGDCYVIVPTDLKGISFENIKSRYSEDIITDSALNEDNFTFHLISEISLGNVLTYEEAQNYFDKTFCHFQGINLNIHNTINDLLSCNAVVQDGKYLKVTPIGKISSWLFFYPQDIYMLYKRLQTLEENDIKNAIKISVMLGDLYSHSSIINAMQKNAIKADDSFNLTNVNKLATVYSYYLMINNKINNNFKSIMIGLITDLDRLQSACLLLNSYYNLGKENLIKRLFSRVRYGIPYKMTQFAIIKGIGKVILKNLMHEKVYNVKDLKTLTEAKIKKIFRSQKIYDKIMQNFS